MDSVHGGVYNFIFVVNPPEQSNRDILSFSNMF